MDLQVLGSSSRGNSYLLDDGRTKLLLEAGLPLKELQTKLSNMGVPLHNMESCLVSHQHTDHSKAVNDLLKRSMDVYAPQAVYDAYSIHHHRAYSITVGQAFTVGSWRVLPFDTVHDVPSVGFLLASQSGEKVCFVTDSAFVRHRFTGVTHYLIEVNYSEEILDNNIAEGRVPAVMKNRLIKSHMSLETALEFFRQQDMSQCKSITLLHLSDTNSDEELFRRRVQQVTGKQVTAARR